MVDSHKLGKFKAYKKKKDIHVELESKIVIGSIPIMSYLDA